MKKLLVVFVCVAAGAWAQAQHAQFGIKAGYNSASNEQKFAPDYESRSAFHVGGLAHIHVSKYFAVQPELVFSSQGGEAANGNKLQLNYINVPVLAQIMIHNGFRLQTGPQVGFLVSQEVETPGGEEVDIEGYKPLDFSWAVGASYLFPSGFGVDARYNIGISDIYDGSFEAKNRVFQVGLFYQFKNYHSSTRK